MCYGVFLSFNGRLSLPPPNGYLHPPFPVVEEEDVFVPGLPRLVDDAEEFVPAVPVPVVPADPVVPVPVPILPPLGHGAGGPAPAQGPAVPGPSRGPGRGRGFHPINVALLAAVLGMRARGRSRD